MNVHLQPDFPVTDTACQEATGKTLAEWSSAIGANPGIADKRRDAINWLWDQVGRSPTGAWWGTTIWVEHERRIGRTKKDGLYEGYSICSTKTIAAPMARVQEELSKRVGNVTRVREGKDIRASWRTPGVEHDTEVEVLLADKGGKVAITLNHSRIQTRDEADGLRRAWSEELAALKADLEAKA